MRIRPDLCLVDRSSNRPLLVGDIKYKLAKDGRGRATDYQQLLAYTTAMGLAEGVLIYCHSSGATGSHITVRNTHQTLYIRTLDLSGTPAEVEGQLDELAAWILTRSRAA